MSNLVILLGNHWEIWCPTFVNFSWFLRTPICGHTLWYNRLKTPICVKGVLSVSDDIGYFTARKSKIGECSISELSEDTNIFSPQFCLKYPSSKTLFLVSTSNQFFSRFGTRSEHRISKKRESGNALTRSWVEIRIFSHHGFAWNIPLQKHFSRICDQGNNLGDPDRFGRKNFVTGLQDVQDFLLMRAQSVVIPVPNMQILDNCSQTNSFEALLIMNTSVVPIYRIWVQIHLSLKFWYWQIPFNWFVKWSSGR